MENDLAQKAVSLAIKCEWSKARDINLEILKINKNDVDALNRLARCYFELGDGKSALATVGIVLKIDSSNTIALKCISKYKTPPGKKLNGVIPVESFLEEPGKTKIVELYNLGDKTIINCLNSGELVKMASHTHKVSITTYDNKYIGRLSDDLAAKLRGLIKLGNKYQALVKSVKDNQVVVFIREIENKTKNPTFLTEKIDYVSYTPPELVHKDVGFQDLES